MASNYNRRLLPAEVLVENGRARADPPAPDARRRAGAGDADDATQDCSDRLRRARSERQADAGRAAGRPSKRAAAPAVLLDFPAYETAIGHEIDEALHGGRDYAADVMQLLYVANRYEKKPQIERLAGRGRRSSSAIATSRRASPTARRRGSIRRGCADMQRYLPPPDLTILLDIAPETAAGRKTAESRSVRARPGAAVARARELSPPGAGGRLAAPRRRARQGRRRRGRAHGRRATARAAVSARTSFAPASSSDARARIQRRPGRAHVVHQHDRQTPSTLRAAATARTRRGRWRAASRPAGPPATPSRRVRAARRATGRPRCRASSARLVEAARALPRCDAAAPGRRRRRPTAPRRRRRACARARCRATLGARRISARERWRAASLRRRRSRAPWRRRGGRRATARAQRVLEARRRRQDGSGSPQVRQQGGVIGTIAAQQRAQTAPRVGSSSGWRHAAQAGASRTASSAVGERPQNDVSARSRGGGSSDTSMRSASPHSRSSE